MHYWDTSTLAKLYVGELDSSIFAAYLASTGAAVASELARWEIFRGAARKEAEGFIGVGMAEVVFERFLADVLAGKLTLVPFDETVEKRYRDLVLRLHRLSPPVVSRTLDCVHIATAELIGAEEIVTTDVGMRKAAGSLGLKVYP